MISPLRFWLVILWAVANGCGPGVEEGPIPLRDTIDTADIDTSAPFDCPDPLGEQCAGMSFSLRAMVRAEQIGNNVQMVSFSRNAILLKRTSDSIQEPIVWVLDFQDPDDMRYHALAQLPSRPQSSMRPIGLAYNLSSPFDRESIIVLISEGQGSTDRAAALYTSKIMPGSSETAALVPMENGVLPASVELRGLTYLNEKASGSDTSYLGRICAYGDGIFCFDGSHWTTEIEPSAGSIFNDLSILKVDNNHQIIAVGDQGRIAIDSPLGWYELESNTSENLLNVSVNNGSFIAVGTLGAWVSGTGEEAFACSISTEDLVAINRLTEQFFKGVTASGKIFSGQLNFKSYELCFTGEQAHSSIVGSAIEARFNACGSSIDNYLVLTPDVLYGTDDCTTPL